VTDYDTDGSDFDEDDPCFITPDSPPEAQIHVHHLAVIRLGKRALVDAIETGTVLQEERNRRGDDFGNWVDTQLGLSRSEAECYIRFYEESGIRTEQLSPAVEVKLPRVLELLGQLNNAVGKGAVPVRPAGTDDNQPKPTVVSDVDNTPTEQSPKPKEVTSRPVKASERAKKRTTKATAKAKPVKQDRDDRQPALTAEQEQLLMRRSPKLFMQLRMGNLRPEEALRLAKDLPGRNAPQQT
jgi:hypothetical protein